MPLRKGRPTGPLGYSKWRRQQCSDSRTTKSSAIDLPSGRRDLRGGPAWFSVVGLILDILGFAILAWDVWPEYLVSRRRTENASDHASTIHTAEAEPPTDAAGRVAGEALELLVLARIGG